MPQPQTSLATPRPELSASFEEFDLEAEQGGFIGHQILRLFSTPKKSGTFGRIPIEELLKHPETKRAPASRYNRGEWTFEEESYACKEKGWEEPCDDTEAENYSDFFEAQQVCASIARDVIRRGAERRIEASIFNATTWTPTAVTNEWDDFANATPIDDVETKVQAIYLACGLWPNTMVISRTVFRNLRHCAQIRDRISSSGAGSSELASRITVAQLREAFDIDRVLVGGGTERTSADGQSTITLAGIWSNEYCWIGRTAVTNNLREPCIGRTFYWTQDGGMPEGTMESYRDESVRSDIIRARHDVDEKIIMTECAGLLSNITT